MHITARSFEKSAQAILNFNDSGLSILEISHRSKDFVAVMKALAAIMKGTKLFPLLVVLMVPLI
jgi:phosphoserine aminotransferase